MENRLHPGRQVRGHHGLRDPITNGRHTQHSVPPPDFGIATAFTSGGKYVPELIRFQIL